MNIKNLIVGIALVALGALLYWVVAPQFTTKEVNDSLPALHDDTNEMPESMRPHVSLPASIVGTSGHAAEGTVRIITNPDGSQQLVYENFKTVNGPDLFVYLSRDREASDIISLGRLRGTEGTLVYDIPRGVNIADYPYALVWCKAFSVLFNSADLSSIMGTGDTQVCIQVITAAKNPDTGAIQEFPTPCDVPSGWEIIQNDIPSVDLELETM